MNPRRIRLTRAAGLRGLHAALAARCLSADLERVRASAVLLPSRSSAAQLRTTLEGLALVPAGRPPALAMPDLLTRDDWYRALRERAGIESPMLSPLEREVLMGAAARAAADAGVAPPFRMRPGLVAEMLAFFDALGRQRRSIDRFEALVLEDLAPRAEFDRGAERLLRQTRFLAAAFREFERRVEASAALDEHLLRRRLLERVEPPRGPGLPEPVRAYRLIVIAVPDHAADPAGGLYPADFDLLTRLPRLEAVEIVATERLLATGFDERLREMLPGLEEETWAAAEAAPPRLAVPDGAAPRLFFGNRDREEELRAAVRRVKRAARAGALDPGRAAIVVGRPLPYVYLAQAVLESARVEYQLSDALPLAAEPYAALLDQVFAVVAARFGRAPLVDLMRSPHLAFDAGGEEPARAIGDLDRALREAGYLGDPRRLEALAAGWSGSLAVAARAACRACAALGPLAGRAPVSSHVATLVAFLDDHERPYAGADEPRGRHLRARAAVRATLDELGAAARRHDDPPVRLDVVADTVRRWLEAQTFTPRRGTAGVQLVDARAARYGDFDAVHLAGLVEGEWPEPAGRNIFYPPFLLSQLGWPADPARVEAARASFHDLLRLARVETSVSSFSLEHDVIVEPSPLLEQLEQEPLQVWPVPERGEPVFTDEALVAGSPAVEALSGEAALWLRVRLERPHTVAPAYAGLVGPMAPAARGHAVSAIDRYLDCPFKYFAATVLRLPEEATDSPAMSPKDRGVFEHEVFRAFFAEWQQAGGGAIRPEALDTARALFGEIAAQHLARLPEGEASLERMRLLGSPASAGLGEIALAAEAVRPVGVRERLLEHPIEGEFVIQGHGGPRQVRLRGKADRVDLLEDQTFRVIDYKSGRAPDGGRSIQLPVYAVCVQQDLRATRGEGWGVAEASYLAFGEKDAVRVVVGEGPAGAAPLAEGQQRLLEAVDGIERGDFAVRPATTRLCATCGYAGVCRRDYAPE